MIVVLWISLLQKMNLRKSRQKKKKKKQGLTKGIPDIFLPVPIALDNHGFDMYYGLFIELKRADKSKSIISPEQKIILAALNNQGYKAVVCYGHKEVINAIKEYLCIYE